MKRNSRYIFTGALAGMANGLFGSGGGIFLVPLLTRWCGMKQKKAFASSVAIIFLLSPVSLFVFWLRGGEVLGGSWPYLVGGAAGGVLAGCLFPKLSAVTLKRLFGGLLVYGGIRAVLLL